MALGKIHTCMILAAMVPTLRIVFADRQCVLAEFRCSNNVSQCQCEQSTKACCQKQSLSEAFTQTAWCIVCATDDGRSVSADEHHKSVSVIIHPSSAGMSWSRS
jgi:hypothetical protein